MREDKLRNRVGLSILLFLFLMNTHMITNVKAFVPVSYTCCYNYTNSDGVQLSDFENKSIGGIQLDNFENLNNWIVGGIGASQQPDSINFEEGSQSLKLIATGGNRAYTDKVINNNFSTTTNFVIWIYLYNASSFNYSAIYFTSTGASWSKYFSKTTSPGTFMNGWNKIVISKNDFFNINGESWNNTMNRVRIAIYPISGDTNASLDDFKIDVPNDWIAGMHSSLQSDTINFKEGQQGLKLIATNGTTAYMDFQINNNFSNTNNFAIWTYIDNASNSSGIMLYLTSNGSAWNQYFYEPIWNGFKTGWNKLVFNKNSFKSNGPESWDNTMNRIRLRTYPSVNKNLNVTFDDLRYDMTGQRAKLIITFDDGDLSVRKLAYPVLSANNQSGVSFVIASEVTDNSNLYMSLSDLQTLQTSGWDISSHTVNHVDLTSVNSSELTSELNDSYDWLVNNNFQKSAGFIAYPYGAYNDDVIAKVKQRYIFGRATSGGSAQQHFTQSDDGERYIQRVIYVLNTTTVQSVKDMINDSVNAKLLGILLFHDIVSKYPRCTDTDPCTYQYLAADFQAISDYIKSRSNDIDVVTYSDYVIPNINNFTPVINKTTRIYSNGSSVMITRNKLDEYMPNMTVNPSSGYVDINITSYNESDGIKFNESGSDSNLQVSYDIGDRIPNKKYSVKIYWVNGTKYQDFNVLANNTGYISYSSEGFGSQRYQIIDFAPADDTSFTVSLPVGYTFLRFNASNSTITNLNVDGQNNSQPMFNITNNGNINQSFILYLDNVVNNITTYADLSNNFSTGKIEINTSNTTIIPSLNPGSSQNIWMIVDVNKAPVTNTNRTLIINSNTS